MHWRFAQKRWAKKQPPSRPMECHLGDVPDGLEPIRPPYRRRTDHPRWVEGWTHVIVAGVACITFAVLVIAFVVMLFLYAGARPARAHGDAQWIQDGRFKNAIGELCCGVRDCNPIADDDVITRPDGFYIISLKETVPYAEATPTPLEGGGRYWRCQWGGQRKCFFAPPGAT